MQMSESEEKRESTYRRIPDEVFMMTNPPDARFYYESYLYTCTMGDPKFEHRSLRLTDYRRSGRTFFMRRSRHPQQNTHGSAYLSLSKRRGRTDTDAQRSTNNYMNDFAFASADS